MSFISSKNKDLRKGIIEVLCGKSALEVKKEQYVFRYKKGNNLTF